MRLRPQEAFVLAGLFFGPACDQFSFRQGGESQTLLTSRSSNEKSAPQDTSKVTPLKTSQGEHAVSLPVRQADYLVTKLRLEEAGLLLSSQVGPDAARSRARLAIYQADCEGAVAHLASSAARKVKGAEALHQLGVRCSRATAGAIVIDDKEAGVWLRIQDDADQLLAPFVVEVAVRAREGLERDLGVELPRPLRIDLVRDLFSLSAVSGLPLEAAETTGTVAVARWGRVTMVSPRAMHRGFPWADTLAHEITHLLLSLATADRAPLWLQEGIAKREEHRWREAQAFDEVPDFSKRAYEAQIEGNSVGVDQIGPSIAMLPSANAASIAFAEVTSFMKYWIRENGPHSLPLLLRDIEVAADADAAMRSVSGFSVSDWQAIWRADLIKRFEDSTASPDEETTEAMGPRAVARVIRVCELLANGGHAGEAAETAAPAVDRASHSAALRFYAARAGALADREDLDFLLGDLDDVDGPHGGWLALKARRMSELSSSTQAHSFFTQAMGLDPLLPEVACEGLPWVGQAPTKAKEKASESNLSEICLHARSLPLRGAR